MYHVFKIIYAGIHLLLDVVQMTLQSQAATMVISYQDQEFSNRK